MVPPCRAHVPSIVIASPPHHSPHDVPAYTIHEERFLDAGDATLRFGPGYASGIIAVTTRR